MEKAHSAPASCGGEKAWKLSSTASFAASRNTSTGGGGDLEQPKPAVSFGELAAVHEGGSADDGCLSHSAGASELFSQAVRKRQASDSLIGVVCVCLMVDIVEMCRRVVRSLEW